MNTPLQAEEKNLRRVKIYRAVSVALVAAAVLFRTLNLFLFYEADSGYYRAGAVLPTVFRVFLLLCTAFFAVYAFVCCKKPTPTPTSNGATVIASLAVGATFAVTALLRYCLSATAMTRSTLFAFIAGGLAAIYFILFGLKKLATAPAVLTGFGTILWFGCILVVSYFDVTEEMNAPLKVVLHLACLGGMLLMLAETRLACGVSRKRFYLFALSTGTLALCTSAIPSLIAGAAGILESRDLGYADFACMALGLFGLVRLLSPFHIEAETEEDAIEEEAPVVLQESDLPDEETTDTPPQKAEASDDAVPEDDAPMRNPCARPLWIQGENDDCQRPHSMVS